MGLVGLSPSETAYNVVARSSAGVVYKGSGTIRVGSSFTAAPNPRAIHSNETRTALVTRGGVLATLPGVVTATVSSSDTNVATVLQPQLVYTQGVPVQPLPVKAGFMPGTATITVNDAAHRVVGTFTVNVVQRVVLLSDLRLTPGGPAIYAEGTVLTTGLIDDSPYILDDYRVSPPDVGCAQWHCTRRPVSQVSQSSGLPVATLRSSSDSGRFLTQIPPTAGLS
jgi:hypothetical protein